MDFAHGLFTNVEDKPLDDPALLEDDDDVWYNEDKLYRDHIQEVFDKWPQIDEEIWAKVIVFERNRRIAKAYARTPVLTVNGTEEGFDGYRIGLCGFENPMRDDKTEEFKRHIGYGIKMKMDDSGNLLIKRMSKCNIYIKNTNRGIHSNVIGNDILKLPNLCLDPENPVKLFDIKKFQSSLNRERRSAHPDRKRLERQCCSAVAFVKSEETVLECPIWILIINIVAVGMLKAKLPLKYNKRSKSRSRIPIPEDDDFEYYDFREFCDECPGQDKLSLLPSQKYLPRSRYIPPPDYDDSEPEYECCRRMKCCPEEYKIRKNEDPYYCGLEARVPVFTRKESENMTPYQASQSLTSGEPSSSAYSSVEYYNRTRLEWAKVNENEERSQSIYSQVYGGLPARRYIPARGFVPRPPSPYIGDWD